MPARSNSRGMQWTNEELARILAALIDSVDEAIQVVDQDAITVFYNEKAAEFDDTAQEKVIGKHILEVLPSTQLDTNTIMSVLKTGVPSGAREETRVLRDGRILSLATSVHPIVMRGRVVGAIRVVRDATFIREVAQKLLSLETMLLQPCAAYEANSDAREGIPAACRPTAGCPALYCPAPLSVDDLVGISPSARDMRQQARRFARGLWPLVLWGEHGSGKEFLARIIHSASERRGGQHEDRQHGGAQYDCRPFIVKRCHGFPEEVIWTMLTGDHIPISGDHISGNRVSGDRISASHPAIAGPAPAARRGLPGRGTSGDAGKTSLIEAASAGTLLLKDIDLTSFVFQSRIYDLIAAPAASQDDMRPRIMLTMTQDPFIAVARGMLSRELFTALNSFSIHVPPLRDRKEDIPLLVEHFISKLNGRLGSSVQGVAGEVATAFQEYNWPGNIRELWLVLESAVCMADGPIIQMEHLPPGFVRALKAPKDGYGAAIGDGGHGVPGGKQDDLAKRRPLRTILRKKEAEMLVQSLVKAAGNVSEAARLLGMPRQTLQYRLKRLGIIPGEFMGKRRQGSS
ncbi:MAG TPA: PAS domain S-box protein [Firmicutes bacterium]|nr:PAS domain S-box protein [Bacillota bacterium]